MFRRVWLPVPDSSVGYTFLSKLLNITILHVHGFENIHTLVLMRIGKSKYAGAMYISK